jgi:hypothetical protein
MSIPHPIYTSDNCRAAYQLNWSVSLFANAPLPDKTEWFTELAKQTETDGIRLLECRHADARLVQFLASTTPATSPSEILRSI